MGLTPPIPTFDAQPLRGRVVLVTGGAQGIGRGIAHCVLAAGGAVVIGDSDDDAGAACIEEWDAGAAAMFVHLDVSKERSVRRFVDAARREYGRIDGLVNNAANADPHSGKLEALSLADWNRYLATNLSSAFLCSRDALPALRESKGAIVNIASTRAMQSEPDTECYATSKGGLVAFTHALAISAGPDIRVNCISPGWVPTEAWQKPASRRRPKLGRKDQQQHPVGRVGTPEDIGMLAVYLLSDAAGFITGQNFVADGGMSRKMIYA
ncbi:glucose 1-dehydrogenase [Cognatilysobacter terrigena]|uniref:glucose 1-dehydrogenase n=1 Tax=Cognatilysobacter terrigena TaxID=2488749 RepID=UPI00105FF3F9|nr:glucose 1-dehydrogenase [Lysobacter terrigena]